MKQAVITVDNRGDVTIDMEGFVGKECEKATEALEQLLSTGSGRTSKDYKPEYYETEGAKAENLRF